MAQMIDCPAHEGAYDCTPFCAICEGEQEYDPSGEMGWLAVQQLNSLNK
jgi:hypothetical protein